MNGLKVYLKSGIHRSYFILQIAVGLFLLINAVHFLESEHNLVLEVLLSGIGGTVVLTSLALPHRFRRRWRHLSGLFILAAGAILFSNALTALKVTYTPWQPLFYYVGICLMGIGILSPILNPRYFIYLSKRGIRIRNNPFQLHRVAWGEVARVEMGERHLEISTQNGRNFRLTPVGSQSQHLRAHIDEASRSGMLQSPQSAPPISPSSATKSLSV